MDPEAPGAVAAEKPPLYHTWKEPSSLLSPPPPPPFLFDSGACQDGHELESNLSAVRGEHEAGSPEPGEAAEPGRETIGGALRAGGLPSSACRRYPSAEGDPRRL
uniref:Uncharacterized protein n=1 Tax=Sphaerodactylus townsendi TaxID=933632 RepID=A0ACB8EKW8_9SAUR